MTWFITTAARLLVAEKQILEKKWSFFGVFAVIFGVSVVVLAQMGLLPEAPKASKAPVVTLETSMVNTTSQTLVAVAEEPVKIEIPAINLSVPIANPTKTDTETLDKELLSGAVRYPTSALLGAVGNVVLFGHSSYLPIVNNQAYKAFNGIQKLVVGDTVTVYSAGTAYTYAVRTVEKESAASDAGINLAVTGHVLTLATCDSFGTKSDRFVVTADFVESHVISS